MRLFSSPWIRAAMHQHFVLACRSLIAPACRTQEAA